MTVQELVAIDNNRIELAIRAWIDAKRGKSGSEHTARSYEDALRAFRSALWGVGCDLDSNPDAVGLAAQRWAGLMTRKDSAAGATYNLRLAILSSFYTYAIRRRLLSGPNPIEMVERRVVLPYQRAKPLNFDDVREQLAAIDRNTLIGKRDYAILAVALSTGRRMSELLALTFGDVTIERSGRTLVDFLHTKGGKDMADSLPLRVGRALLDYASEVKLWMQEEGLKDRGAAAPLWVNLSPAYKGRSLGRKGFGDLVEARLGTRKTHALRHTFAALMDTSDASVRDIQHRLGHTSAATTETYLAALHSKDNPFGDAIADLLDI